VYVILKSVGLEPRQPQRLHTIEDVCKLPLDGFYAVDIETRGLCAEDPACHILGIGLANDTGCYYIDLRDTDISVHDYLKQLFRTGTFTCFNSLFDMTFLSVWCGKWPTTVSDSYALAKQLSTEGFNGQSWSLEVMIREVLDWPKSNKTTMDALLKSRGLTKADLWQLTPDELAEYCALDAEAHWQLHHELLKQAQPWPALIDYHKRIFLPNVQLLSEQQLRGMKIDQDILNTCHSQLMESIHTARQSFLQHPQVSPHIEERSQEARAAWIAAEPRQYTAKGDISKNWEKWKGREQEYVSKLAFNPNSKPQLAQLFHDKLKLPVRKRTATGRPVIDKKILPTLGEPGKILSAYNLMIKRRGYVEAVIANSAQDGRLHPQFNSVGTATLRLGGGGKRRGDSATNKMRSVNVQQMPKMVEFLASFVAGSGNVLVQDDAQALEPTILAEFSQDKTLLSVYGADAKPNDIYLLIGSKLGALGKSIRQYYDADNPSVEGIELAKKHCKRERSIAKQCKLAYDYGAGAPKMHSELIYAGIDLSLKEVRDIRRDMDHMFVGIKQFESKLVRMWQANNGWIPSILGTPICVADQYIKDIVNRFCQTSGHLVLQLWIANIKKLKEERNIQMFPWLIDLHDEGFWECSAELAQPALSVVKDALKLTNDELDMGAKIKGAPMIISCMGESKCPEDYPKWRQKYAGK
jgi:hypothetical protein